MLLHWPGVDAALRYRAYEALLQMQQQGQARQVGVSNFLIDQLEDLAAQGLPKPVCNQLEAHPWYPQREVRAYCHRQGIQVVCWAPLFRGAWKEAPVLAQIAQAHGKTPAQAVLRWHVQNGDCPIPKSVTPSRIAENLDIFDFALTPQEMAAIDALEDGRQTAPCGPDCPRLQWECRKGEIQAAARSAACCTTQKTRPFGPETSPWIMSASATGRNPWW